VCKIAFKMGDQKMKCNQFEVSVLSINAVLHVSSLLELYYFVVCLLLKDLKCRKLKRLFSISSFLVC
jgi:hypothetical protein